MKTFSIKLNRRHKAALFLTLIAVGAGLLLGIDAKQIFGIILLGAAFAWALGTDSRLVHWLFVATGLTVMLFPFGLECHERYKANARYKSDIAAWKAAKITDLVPIEPKKDSISPPPPGFIPETAPGQKFTIEPPEYILPDYKPKPFRPFQTLAENWWFEVSGILTVGVGLGLIFAVRPQPK